MAQLRFVQMDEFVPIRPSQKNSFHHFISQYYIEGFGLDPSNCLLIDTSHIVRPEDSLDSETVHELELYCAEYERKIKSFGDIDFFLGGLGPDGHIAFNIKGSRAASKTRLLKLNYESMAASAESLGGMSSARNKHVITIGLSTITSNPSCQAVIIAAGEAKAQIVKEAVESDSGTLVPSHALRKLPQLVFYITRGASKLLSARHTIEPVKKQRVLSSIQRGSATALQSLNFLHTEPHHDDILLGYLPFILKSRPKPGLDFFACGTSGFNSVSNQFILDLIGDAPSFIESYPVTFLSEDASEDVRLFASGIHQKNERMQSRATARRFIRNTFTAPFTPVDVMKRDLIELRLYVQSLNPGEKGVSRPELQALKGKCREFESECLWGYLGWGSESIAHLRLGFYTNEIFTPQPHFERDSKPILELLLQRRPDVVTLALDPEGSGPDTHFKFLQAMTSALDEYVHLIGPNQKQPVVWGYRNVWCKFDLADTDIILPVDYIDMKTTLDLFEICFRSQKTAEFPSHLLDGPFSQIAKITWENQLKDVLQLLGPQAMPETTEGLIYIKEMSVEQLKSYSSSLSRAVEET
jgi:glucosamine-6-phosphate deaminase